MVRTEVVVLSDVVEVVAAVVSLVVLSDSVVGTPVVDETIVLVVGVEVLVSSVEVPVDLVDVLLGLLLVAMEEAVVGNKVVDVSLVLVAVGDDFNVELV